MGLTTWAAARFFLKTVTQPGTLTLEIAHTQEAAEEIFRIVHRFLDWLPEELRRGVLRTSRANVRQIVFPEIDSQYRVESAADRNAGRGLTVQNLHCSELARWPGDPAETLAGLRAAMAPGGGADSGIDAGRRGRVLSRGVAEGRRDGNGAALLSLVDGTALPRSSGGRSEPDRGRAESDCAAWLGSGADWVPAQIRADFRGLARQEYAEDEESCFLASGDSVFELSAVEARLATAPPPVEAGATGSWRFGCRR